MKEKEIKNEVKKLMGETLTRNTVYGIYKIVFVEKDSIFGKFVDVDSATLKHLSEDFGVNRFSGKKNFHGDNFLENFKDFILEVQTTRVYFDLDTLKAIDHKRYYKEGNLTAKELKIELQLKKWYILYNVKEKDLETGYISLISAYDAIDKTNRERSEALLLFARCETKKIKKANVTEKNKFCREFLNYLKKIQFVAGNFLKEHRKSTDFKVNDIVFNEETRVTGKILKLFPNSFMLETYYTVGQKHFQQNLHYQKETFYKHALANTDTLNF